MATSEIRRRIQRFASLRGARRALGRSVHPAELAAAKERERELLIRLQALSAGAREGSPPAAFEEELHRVDALLDDASTGTREILHGLAISELRSTVPLLSSQYPDEVRGLIDVMLEGDIEEDKILRTLEYLITMLSSQERDGRRAVVRDPSDASVRLRELTQQRLVEPGPDYLVAERSLNNSITQLLHSEDIGSIRDRVRRFKEELGSQILHPRILAAAVSYNVAMWNQMTSRLDGSRSLDQLADELLSVDSDEGARGQLEPPSPAQPSTGSREILGSAAFARIVSALRARLTGEASVDEPAAKIVANYQLDGLDPAEVEAFDTQGEDQIAQLTRAATVLGLTIRHLAGVKDSLRALGIDPQILETRCPEELALEMSAVARKLFADGRYGDAFHLSEIKTRNLATLVVMQRRREGRPPSGSAAAGHTAPPRESRAWKGALGSLSRIFQLNLGGSSGAVWGFVLLLGLMLIGGLLWPSGRGVAILSEAELSGISPFLESGHRGEYDERMSFIGRVGRGWDYLGTPERRAVVAEIGRSFEARGTGSVVLVDRWKRIQARYEDGAVVSVAPKLSATGERP